MSEILSDTFKGLPITGNIVFPASLTQIGKGAFKNWKLGNVDLSRCINLDTICRHAFEESEITGKITFPSGLNTIEKSAFRNSTLCNVDLSRCSNLGTWEAAFIGSKITGTVEMCPIWTEIPVNAFNRAEIASIDFSRLKKLTSIKSGAFYNSNLDYVNLIGCINLTDIEDMAFGFYHDWNATDMPPKRIVILPHGQPVVCRSPQNFTLRYRTRREMISYRWYLLVGVDVSKPPI
jgi:hypothetical protein